MKIIHIVFAGPYTPGATYQDNLLPRAQHKSGHIVEVWTTCYRWIDGKLTKVPAEVFEECGVTVRRFEFQSVGIDFITRKLRWVRGIEHELEKAAPDLIVMHDFQTFTGKSICRYLANHKKIKMVIDSHTDILNSGRNFLSRYVLHRMIYASFANELSKYAEKIYYITPDTKDFLINEYGLNSAKMEYLSLGGNTLSDDKYSKIRKVTRQKYNISEESVVLLHSGKMSKSKKTKMLLDLMGKIENTNLLLYIAGVCTDDVQRDVDVAVRKDKRIKYVGWQSGEELNSLMCAADIYVQPGTYSASLQNSICCRCLVITAPHRVYTETGVIKGNGFFVTSVEELIAVISALLGDKRRIDKCKYQSQIIAQEMLDYSCQGKRIASIIDSCS